MHVEIWARLIETYHTLSILNSHVHESLSSQTRLNPQLSRAFMRLIPILIACTLNLVLRSRMGCWLHIYLEERFWRSGDWWASWTSEPDQAGRRAWGAKMEAMLRSISCECWASCF